MIEVTMKFVVDGSSDMASEFVGQVNDLVGGAFEDVIGDNPGVYRTLTDAEAAAVEESLIE